MGGLLRETILAKAERDRLMRHGVGGARIAVADNQIGLDRTGCGACCELEIGMVPRAIRAYLDVLMLGYLGILEACQKALRDIWCVY